MAEPLKCNHCEGTGTCHAGSKGWSCDGCQKNAGFERKDYRTVPCSVCGGTGYAPDVIVRKQ